MQDFKNIYDQFYNADPTFKSDFADLNAFNSYVDGNAEVIERLKEVYNFEPAKPLEEPPIAPMETAPEIKKKEDSISTSTSVGDSLPSPSEPSPVVGDPVKPKRPKVEVGALSDPQSIRELSAEFLQLEDRKNKYVQPKAIGETLTAPMQILDFGILNNDDTRAWLGYWGIGDGLYAQPEEEKLTPGELTINEIEKLQVPLEKQIKESFKKFIFGVSNEEGISFANPLIKSVNSQFVEDEDLRRTLTDENGNVVSEGQALKEIKTPVYDEKVINNLLKADPMISEALGEGEVKYNFVVDEEKLADFTAQSWIEFQKIYFPDSQLSWWEVNNTRLGEIYKNTIREEVTEGAEQVAVLKTIDKNLKAELGIGYDNLESSIKEKAAAIQVSEIKNFKNQSEKTTAFYVSKLGEQITPIQVESDLVLNEFRTKYEKFLDPKTQKYTFQTQEEIDNFKLEYEKVSNFLADQSMKMAELQAQTYDELNQELKDLENRSNKNLDKQFSEFTTGKYSPDALDAIIKKSIGEYYLNKNTEIKKAEGEFGYLDNLLGVINKSLLNLSGGLGLHIEQMAGGRGRISAFFRDLGNFVHEYEFAKLNPSVLKYKKLPNGQVRDESTSEFLERITTMEGFGEFLGDVGLVSTQSLVSFAPVLLGVKLMGAAKVNSSIITGAATIGSFSTDTWTQLSEQYKSIYEKTGSTVLALKGVREQYASQIDLFYTYLLETSILFGKGKITSVKGALAGGVAKLSADIFTEAVFQESNQNFTVNKTTHEVVTGTPYEGKWEDELKSKRLWMDVTAGSGGMVAVTHTFDTYRQLRAEKIKNNTLNMLNTKGLAALVLDANKRFGKDAAIALGFTMRMQGTLNQQEYDNYVKTINRLNEFSEVVATKDISDERKIATVDKMRARNELVGQQEAAETEEKKAQLAEEIKKLDQQIADLQDNTKEVKVSSIVDFKTGRVIYATDDQAMLQEFKKNPELASQLLRGISEGVFVMNTEDEELSSYVKKTVAATKNWYGFMADRQKLKNEYLARKAKSTKDRLEGKKNTEDNLQIEREYQAEINALVKKYDMPFDIDFDAEKARRNQESQAERQATDAVQETPQFNIPESVGTTSMFDAENTEILDAFIKANEGMDTAIAKQLLTDIKTQVATFKQLFPEGKIFFHTKADSFTRAYNKATGENQLTVTDDGFYAATENGEIHINLSNVEKVSRNNDVVAHEIFHGVLQQAFGKKIYDENGKFLRWETDQQALEDMKAAIEVIVNRYGSTYSNSLENFLKFRNYDRAEETEEFLVQLGALLSRADRRSPLEQGFVERVLAAISQFVKDKTGIDIFSFYRKQADALQFFNYIGSQIATGQKIDEKAFQPVQGGFMIPRNLDAEALYRGNLETGTVVAVRKSSDNLNPFLNQFTKRPGTSRLAYDLPVKSMQDAVKEHQGGVLLIMSDNTGFFVDPETGEFVMGGYGYMASRRNIDAAIGFASVNEETVRTTMTNATAANEGKPVLALIVLSSPTAALGNYYALRYTFGSLPTIFTSEKQANEFKQSMISTMRNKLGILDTFEKDRVLVKERKTANKVKDFGLVSELKEKSMTNFDKNFLPFFNAIDFTSQTSVDNFIKQFTKGKYTFPQRQNIIETLLPSHEGLKLTSKSPQASKILFDAGLNQMSFHNKYGEPQFVGDRLYLDGSTVKGQWGSVFGGFTIDPKTDPSKIQNKGLRHPQFNAKIPGYNHFLLDGEYEANANFFDALQFGDPSRNPIDQMATQGIQPGTRLPASNKNPDALTAQERRDMLGERTFVKRSMEALNFERGSMESMAEQFAKRLGVEHSFYFDENDNNVWRRDALGNIQMNTANANLSTPIYAFSGVFLEIFRNENVVEYNKLIGKLLKDKSVEAQNFRDELQAEINRAIEQEYNGYMIPGGAAEIVEANKATARLMEQAKSTNTIENILKGAGGKYNINNIEFNELLEKAIMLNLGKIVEGEYDLNTGIYKALKDIWDKILDIIKTTFNFNKVNVKDISIPSGMDTPLEFIAKLLADPRNEFLRDKNAMAMAKGKIDILKEHKKMFDYYTTGIDLINGDKISIVETTGGELVTTSIENFSEMEFAINDVLLNLFGVSNSRNHQAIIKDFEYSVLDNDDVAEEAIRDNLINNIFSPSNKILVDNVISGIIELRRSEIDEIFRPYEEFLNYYILKFDEYYFSPNSQIKNSNVINQAKLLRSQMYFVRELELNRINTLKDVLVYVQRDRSIARNRALDIGFNSLSESLFSEFLSKASDYNGLQFKEGLRLLSSGYRGEMNQFLDTLDTLNNSGIFYREAANYALFETILNYIEEDINSFSSPFDRYNKYLKGRDALQNVLNGVDIYRTTMNPPVKNYSKVSEKNYANSEQFKKYAETTSNSKVKLITRDNYSNGLNELIAATPEFDFYTYKNQNLRRSGVFEIVANSDKTIIDSRSRLEVGKVSEGDLVEMKFTTSISPNADGSFDINISFAPSNVPNTSYSTEMSWGTQVFEVFNKLINGIYATHQDVPFSTISFTPMGDSKTTQAVDKKTGQKLFNPDGTPMMESKEIRKNLYNMMARKAMNPFMVIDKNNGVSLELPNPKRYVENENRIRPMFEEMLAQDIDPVNSTVKVKKSRAETLGRQSREIDREYNRMLGEGKTQEQIFGELFGRYSYESMRSSAYSAAFQTVYDEYVSNKAKETWNTYSQTWGKRKQGIVNFVDKYIIENSLMDIVGALRRGVRFIDADNQLLEANESMAMVVEGAAMPMDQNGEIIVFSDLEIYSALFEYGVPQSNLDQIFGLNYRKTIENLLLDEDFDTEIKQNLTEDARASKLTVTFSDLNELSEQLGIMNSTAILNYIAKHLSVEKGSPLLPAVKAIVDKINNDRNASLTDVADEFGRQVEKIGAENVQALAEIGTAAGRILRILRELNKDKAGFMVDALKESKIKVSPAFEQQIRNTFRNLDNARNAFEAAKKKAIKDFTDANVQELQRLEDALMDAEYAVAMLLSDPRLQFRFASEVLTNRAAMSLLSGQTAILSALANLETLAAKYGFNQNIFKRMSEGLVNLIKPDVFSRSGANVFRIGKQEFRNRRLAFSLTHKRSVEQIKRTMLDGTIPNTAQAKFFENVARVNSIQDAKNLVNLFLRFADSFKTRNNISDMDFADIMQVMLYEHKDTGKIILADNKAYSIMGAMVRALMQPQEITSRLMALGMDKYAANAMSKKALLDYISMRTAMDNSQLPEGLIDELIRRGTMTNNAQNVPFVQQSNQPVFYLPGGNPETEFRNLNILMSAIFRDEQNNPFEREGMRATFYADNAFVGGLRKVRKGIRQGMINTYLKSLEAKAEGKGVKKYGYRGVNALIQAANVAQWTVFPFPQIPSNILIQIMARTNPMGAILNSIYTGYQYYDNLGKFYAKYGIGKSTQTPSQPGAPNATQSPMLPSQRTLPSGGSQSLVTTTTGVDIYDNLDIDTPEVRDQVRAAKKKMSTEQKIQFEKDLADAFERKRRFVTAVADIPRSVEFLAVVGFIAASGAVMSSGDDPEKKRVMKELGVNQNDFNVSYFLEYAKAKAQNPKLTKEEFYRKRGGYNFNNAVLKDLPEGYYVKDGVLYDNKNRRVKTDFYLNITNLGTYFGYGLGYMASVYSKQEKLAGAGNELTEGFKEFFDLGSIVTSATGSMFRQTPSIKLVQDALEGLSDDAKKRGQGAQVSANMVASVLSPIAPSLFGKPLSQAEAETVQPSYEIEPSREEPNMGRLYIDVHMKLSRNGVLGLGLGQSEFYQSQIGMFGEDMDMRKTVSEPKSFLSYMESAINFPGLRLGTDVKIGKAADEIERHSQVREFLIGTSYLATAYGNLGGDANMYWRILDRSRKNAFVITDTEDVALTGEDKDKKFKLPNDIYRDELRILGDKMLGVARNYVSGYTLDATKDLVMGDTPEKAKEHIELFFSKLDKAFAVAEQEYKDDFMANRADKIIRTMKDRGLLTEADMAVLLKMKDEKDLKNILESQIQPRWEPTFDKKK